MLKMQGGGGEYERGVSPSLVGGGGGGGGMGGLPQKIFRI